jgi:vitamin B12 transporter
VLAACLITGATVNAQEPAAELDAIVVTASRTPISLGETGSSVSLITREDIERRGSAFAVDLLRDVPGIAVSRSGGIGSQAQIRVRGSEANHVLVLIDGIEASDPSAGDEFQFEHLATSDIERIEIVRGPQSALWGSDAVGGVINVITRSPTAPFEAEGLLESGSFGTIRGGTQFGISGDSYQIGLGLSYIDADGSNASRSGDENDGFKSAIANLVARVDASDQIQLDFAARHTDSTKQFDTTDFIVTGLPIDTDRATDSRQSYLKAAATIDAGTWITHIIKLTHLDTDSENHSDGSSISALSAQKLGFYYQGDVVLPGSINHTLTFAIDHENEDFSQRGTASPFGDPNQDQDLDTTGYVLEYRANPLEAWNLSASARHDQSSVFDSVTTYRLSASYALGDGRTWLRGSYGTGQKSPTFIERFGFFPDAFLGNAALEPEQSEGWEIGVDRTFRDDRVTLSATYFNEVLENEINGFAFDPVALQFTAANLSGESHRRGLETSVSADATDALHLTASYTYIDSTQPDADGAQTREVRRPRHMAAVNVNYTFSARVNVNLNVSYNGTQFDNFFPPFPQPAERRELSSYRLVSLATNFRLTDRLELFARIENVLDEDYEDVLGFATPGLGAYLGIRAQR